MPDEHASCQLPNNAARAAPWQRTLAESKPSLKSMISQICSMSGTTIVTGRNSALRLSGSSLRPVEQPQAGVSFCMCTCMLQLTVQRPIAPA